jgi:hypothetical protein
MSLRYFSFLAALVAGVLMLACALAPVRAQEVYTVSGIHVDATAASSAEAYNVAMAQGRPKAWTILFRRLTRQQDWTRQPQLDGGALLRLSRGYTVANERRSTTRYVADVTYIFNPDAVARTLQGAGIAFTQGAPKRILIVPLAPTYSNNGPWAQALAAPSLHDSVVPFAVASAADAPTLKDINFDTASWGDVSNAAARIKASEAALVQVVYVNNKVTVNIRRLGLGETPVKISVDVPLVQTVTTTYPSAAQAAIRAIEDMWKSRAAVDFSQRGHLTVQLRAGGQEQWGAIQTALAAIENVTAVQVTAMDIGYAQLSITYQGNADQLREAMASAGLQLANRGGEWTIAMNGPSSGSGQ